MFVRSWQKDLVHRCRALQQHHLSQGNFQSVRSLFMNEVQASKVAKLANS